MEPYAFTARQVQAVTGISRPVLGDLLKRDIVAASKHRGTGRGDNHIFNVGDLFGIAVVQFLRPRTETNTLLRAAFAFWHTTVGQHILEAARQGRAESVVVLDDSGKVTVEKDMPVTALAALRNAAVLHVIEPNLFAQKLFAEVAMHRMAGDHAPPGPSGREPRRREAPAEQERPTKKLPALTREAIERETNAKSVKKRRKS